MKERRAELYYEENYGGSTNKTSKKVGFAD
jgi:hypothetical protein